MRNSVFIGGLLCLIASMSWGAMFPVAHSAFRTIDPFYFTIIRYVGVSIILAILLLIIEGKKAFRLEKRGRSVLFYGVMAFTVYNLLIFWGQDLLGESGTILASIMEAMMPMITVVLLWAFHSTRPKMTTLLFIFVAFTGVFLIITGGDLQVFLTMGNRFIPIAFLFIAVIGWVVYTFGREKFTDWSALRYSTLTSIFGTSVSVIVVSLTTATGYTSAPTVSELVHVIPEMSFMIIVAGVIALLGWNIGIKIVKPINGVLFINFAPVTTLAIAYLQGYELTMYDGVGTLMVVLVLFLNNVFERRERKLLLSNPV